MAAGVRYLISSETQPIINSFITDTWKITFSFCRNSTNYGNETILRFLGNTFYFPHQSTFFWDITHYASFSLRCLSFSHSYGQSPRLVLLSYVCMRMIEMRSTLLVNYLDHASAWMEKWNYYLTIQTIHSLLIYSVSGYFRSVCSVLGLELGATGTVGEWNSFRLHGTCSIVSKKTSY